MWVDGCPTNSGVQLNLHFSGQALVSHAGPQKGVEVASFCHSKRSHTVRSDTSSGTAKPEPRSYGSLGLAAVKPKDPDLPTPNLLRLTSKQPLNMEEKSPFQRESCLEGKVRLPFFWGYDRLMVCPNTRAPEGFPFSAWAGGPRQAGFGPCRSWQRIDPPPLAIGSGCHGLTPL